MRNQTILFATRGEGDDSSTVYLTRSIPKTFRTGYRVEYNRENGYYEPTRDVRSKRPSTYLSCECLSGWRRGGLPVMKPGATVRISMFARAVKPRAKKARKAAK